MRKQSWIPWKSGRSHFYLISFPLLLCLMSCGGGSSKPIGTPQLVTVLTGLTSPVLATHAGDGSNRLFIVEQTGRIKILPSGGNTANLYLDISSKVLFGGERGLLGLAFHPQFATNRRFFVNYTRQPDGATVIAEYHQSAANLNVADVTETILFTVDQPYSNHNGGMLAFGKDGYLYIGMGDGGSANDPENRAQNVDELLGKILRIDVDHAGAAAPYSSPPDNPYFGATPGRDEIYAVGLRNPWRFSFDRSTGQLYVGDVGQGAREEIDLVTKGGNYGWRIREGTVCSDLDPALCGQAGLTGPFTDYDHSGGRCSVTGGYIYRGNQQALSQGAYLFGDYCSGEVFLWQNGTQQVLLSTGKNISSFGEDEAGELYLVDLGGTVSRFVPGS